MREGSNGYNVRMTVEVVVAGTLMVVAAGVVKLLVPVLVLMAFPH